MGLGNRKMILNVPVFLIFDDLQNEASHNRVKFQRSRPLCGGRGETPYVKKSA